MLYQGAGKADVSDRRRELIGFVVQQLWGNTGRVRQEYNQKTDILQSGLTVQEYPVLEFSAEFVEVFPRGPGG